MSYDERAEKLFNVRNAIPTFDEDTAQWAKRSSAARERLTCQLDQSYGYGPTDTFDFFPASNSKGRLPPLHVFIHGGYWRARDKSEFSFVAEPFVARGVSVAVVNYALCPAVKLRDIVKQIRYAIAWFYLNADKLGIDSTRIQVSGHSAGGHLAAMLLTTDWASVNSKLPRHPIQSVIAISGLFLLGDLLATSINDDVRLAPREAEELSPALQVPKSTPRTLLAVGSEEGEGFIGQSEALKQNWAPHHPILELRILEGRNHLGALDALAEPDHPLHEKALAMLGIANKPPQ